MPKNIDNVPKTNPDFFITGVAGERSSTFLPRVSWIGHTVSLAESAVYQRRELEFCFRLASEEKFAEDEIDGTFYRTEFPHLLIKYPGTLHRYRTTAARTACFVIYPAEAAETFAAAGIDLLHFALPFQITPCIKALVEELQAWENEVRTPGVPERIDLIAMRLISEVFIQNRKSTVHVLPHQKKIRQIAAFMERHFNEALDCTVLAEKCGMSLRSFFRHWQEVYGKTPARYLLERRMEFARHLLLRSNMDIEAAAENTGFSSAGYFIQAFKRYYGTTPAAFRREHIAKAGNDGQ